MIDIRFKQLCPGEPIGAGFVVLIDDFRRFQQVLGFGDFIQPDRFRQVVISASVCAGVDFRQKDKNVRFLVGIKTVRLLARASDLLPGSFTAPTGPPSALVFVNGCFTGNIKEDTVEMSFDYRAGLFKVSREFVKVGGV